MIDKPAIHSEHWSESTTYSEGASDEIQALPVDRGKGGVLNTGENSYEWWKIGVCELDRVTQ
jgi:hypothetical protein